MVNYSCKKTLRGLLFGHNTSVTVDDKRRQTDRRHIVP